MSELTNVPAGISDPHLRMFLQQVKNVLDNGVSSDGGSLKEQLVSNGLATQNNDGSFTFNPDAFDGVSASNPMADLSIPAAPSSFTATGTENYIVLAWEGIDQNIVSATQIYFSETNDFSTATFAGTATGKVFGFAPENIGTTYYFWIRFLSYAGIESPLNSLTGTAGITDANNVDDLTINTLTVASATIGHGEVSNLMIGDTIQSDNYVPGVSGWTIKK